MSGYFDRQTKQVYAGWKSKQAQFTRSYKDAMPNAFLPTAEDAKKYYCRSR